MAAKSYDTAFLRRTAAMLAEISDDMENKTSKIYLRVANESENHLQGEFAKAITERGLQLNKATHNMAETLEKAEQLLRQYAARLDEVDRQMSEMFKAN